MSLGETPPPSADALLSGSTNVGEGGDEGGLTEAQVYAAHEVNHQVARWGEGATLYGMGSFGGSYDADGANHYSSGDGNGADQSAHYLRRSKNQTFEQFQKSTEATGVKIVVYDPDTAGLSDEATRKYSDEEIRKYNSERTQNGTEVYAEFTPDKNNLKENVLAATKQNLEQRGFTGLSIDGKDLSPDQMQTVLQAVAEGKGKVALDLPNEQSVENYLLVLSRQSDEHSKGNEDIKSAASHIVIHDATAFKNANLVERAQKLGLTIIDKETFQGDDSKFVDFAKTHSGVELVAAPDPNAANGSKASYYGNLDPNVIDQIGNVQEKFVDWNPEHLFSADKDRGIPPHVSEGKVQAINDRLLSNGQVPVYYDEWAHGGSAWGEDVQLHFKDLSDDKLRGMVDKVVEHAVALHFTRVHLDNPPEDMTVHQAKIILERQMQRFKDAGVPDPGFHFKNAPSVYLQAAKEIVDQGGETGKYMSEMLQRSVAVVELGGEKDKFDTNDIKGGNGLAAYGVSVHYLAYENTFNPQTGKSTGASHSAASVQKDLVPQINPTSAVHVMKNYKYETKDAQVFYNNANLANNNVLPPNEVQRRLLETVKELAPKTAGHHGRGSRENIAFFSQFGINSSHAWCADTMVAVACLSGLSTRGLNPAAASIRNVGQRISGIAAQPGDFVVRADGHHTGIITRVLSPGVYEMWQGNHGDKTAYSTVTAGYGSFYRHTGLVGKEGPVASWSQRERHYFFDQPAPTKTGQNSVPGTWQLFFGAGHGHGDSGAIANGLTEAVVVKDIADKAAAVHNKASGGTAAITMPDEMRGSAATSVDNRQQVAGQSDMYISVHANSAEGTRGPEAHGTEIYYWAGDALGQETAERMAAKLTASGLSTKAKSDLAAGRGMHFRELLPQRHNNGKRPAVLIEVGYLTNRGDAQLLGSPEGRQKIGAAITQAATETLNELAANKKIERHQDSKTTVAAARATDQQTGTSLGQTQTMGAAQINVMGISQAGIDFTLSKEGADGARLGLNGKWIKAEGANKNLFAPDAPWKTYRDEYAWRTRGASIGTVGPGVTWHPDQKTRLVPDQQLSHAEVMTSYKNELNKDAIAVAKWELKIKNSLADNGIISDEKRKDPNFHIFGQETRNALIDLAYNNGLGEGGNGMGLAGAFTTNVLDKDGFHLDRLANNLLTAQLTKGGVVIGRRRENINMMKKDFALSDTQLTRQGQAIALAAKKTEQLQSVAAAATIPLKDRGIVGRRNSTPDEASPVAAKTASGATSTPAGQPTDADSKPRLAGMKKGDAERIASEEAAAAKRKADEAAAKKLAEAEAAKKAATNDNSGGKDKMAAAKATEANYAPT